MTKRGFAAATAILVLAACRQAEDQPNTVVASNEVEAPANSPAPAAAAPVSAEQAKAIFHERHEGMEDIGKATKVITRQLKSDSPDLDVIRSSSATIAELAAKSPGWFPPGTGEEVLPKTRALPAIWEKPDDFAARDRDFQQASQALKAAADSGDLAAIKSRFEALGKTCSACHDNYRAKEHPH